MAGQSAGEYIRLIDEFAMFLHETAEFHAKRLRWAAAAPGPEESLTLILRDALQQLQRIRMRVNSANERAVVTFVGLTNVGKSTLLNALLGVDVAPRQNGPCTAVPIEFSFGEQLKVTATYRDRLTRPSWKPDSLPALHERLAALAEEESQAGVVRPRKVVVEMPAPLLAHGLIIADTPGFGAAQVGEAEQLHERSLRQYLLTEATQVFWVVLADQGIGTGERGIYNEIFSEVCDDILVTGSEEWDANDRIRFRKRFASLLGGGHAGKKTPAFHFVSGLHGLNARSNNDLTGLEAAGITALERRIRELAAEPGRFTAAERGMLQLAEDLRFYFHELRDNSGRQVQPWWRPDSFTRFAALRTTLTDHKAIVRLLHAPAANP